MNSVENRFKQYNIPAYALKLLDKKRIQKPTDIQERLMPAAINGKDVIGQSQTGSGKTLAYLLPILSRIDTSRAEVQAVITAPTRELAGQIFGVLKEITDEDETSSVRAKQVSGGTDRSRVMEQLRNPPHIIVATPGRLKDMVGENVINVHTVSMLVIDEADQMLDMGFLEEIDPVAGKMADNLQMMVFSATVPESLQPFLRKYMNNPKHVHVKPEHATPKEMTHYGIALRHRSRLDVTMELVDRLQPFLAIIFASTKEEADELAGEMFKKQYPVEVLHGGLPSRQRKQVMKRIQNLEVQYLVATDLAARGMDIPGISHIINYSLPKELEYFIHRTGRAGRAGLTGESYTLMGEDDRKAVLSLQKQGIRFTFMDFRKGTWTELSKPLFATKQTKRKPAPAPDAMPVKKPKKVKPGYKKKAMADQTASRRRKRK
ncbi:DEAD/DEAH box helicase [Marinococcus luteus]|uniref:DEAD/DEAH box helicase n=1 Tax=Marinococcus luteus TaxID=1122204 RepID=UPI002ACC69F7|nr:DEAD/DEAH box helicase [Marinococcus luteus]MDZ5782965.1 DEAD/DEAH box helicase [Marinococcus luteus]